MGRYGIWVLAMGLGWAQPVVTPGRTVNAASRIPPSLPGGALAPGSRAVIGGLRLGPGQARVTLGGQAARVLKQEPEELEVLLPARLRSGPAALQVTVDGRASKPIAVTVGAGAPGIVETPERVTVRRGEWLTLRATGGAAAEVWIGGVRAAATRRSLGDGLEEIRARVPMSAPLGCGVPMTSAGAASVPGNTVLVAVTEAGKACPEDAWNSALGQPGRAGLVVLARSFQADRATDEGAALFTVRGPGAGWPTLIPGSCGLYRADEGFDPRGSILAQMAGRVPGEGLDAGGRITVAHGSQARALAARSLGFYTRTLDPLPSGPFLSDGPVLIRWMGGRDVGGGSFELEAPAGFTADFPAGPLARPAAWTVGWKGMGADRLALIGVTASDGQNQAMVMALCVAAPDAGRFVMPAWVRAALPATESATVSVASVPKHPLTGWKARGLDRGAALAVEARHVTVAIR